MLTYVFQNCNDLEFIGKYNYNSGITTINQYALCNVVLDITYTRSTTKKFAWAMCGDVIVKNLLKSNGCIIEYPTLSDDGIFDYAGNKYELRQIELEEFNDDSIE